MDLSPEAHHQIVTSEVNKLIGDLLCTICNTGFATQDERDEARVSGTVDGMMTYAHRFCWDARCEYIKAVSNYARRQRGTNEPTTIS